jgi:hypothetical protein
MSVVSGRALLSWLAPQETISFLDGILGISRFEIPWKWELFN